MVHRRSIFFNVFELLAPALTLVYALDFAYESSKAGTEYSCGWMRSNFWWNTTDGVFYDCYYFFFFL